MTAITLPAGTADVRAAGGAGLVTTAMAVAARTVRKYMRSPQLLMTSILAGAMFILLFRYIFGGVIQVGSVPYVDFLIPGLVLTSVLIAGTGTAVAVAEDREHGFFDRLRSLPAPRIALLTGRVLGDLVIITWSTVVTVAMGFLVGFRLHGSLGQALLAFVLCLVYGFAFLWVFVCLGLASPNAQGAQGMTMLAYLFMFISSAYVPANSLPGWLQPIAEHQPVSIMCNAVRSLALGNPAQAGLGHSVTYWVVLSLIWAAAITLAFAPLAVAQYRRTS